MTIPLRFLLAIGCALLGFVFPLMFLLAAWIGWSIYEVLANPPDKIASAPPPKLEPMTRERMHDLCESPAETAFLDAMHDAFDLETSGDALVGAGIRLRSQVKVLRYRLDFLVDERLVVEIDGAQWHSSPEAVERDRIRDIDLQAEGYSICRIPAKVVLYRPSEAIVLVETARAAIPEDTPLPTTRQIGEVSSPSEPVGIRNVLGVISKGINDLDSKVDELTANAKVDKFLSHPLHKVEIIFEYVPAFTVQGPRKDRDMLRSDIKNIWEVLGADLEKGRDYNGDLAELRKAVSTERGRAYCFNAIEYIVDEHLEKLSKWHANAFPGTNAFWEGWDGKFDAREDIITQLREICFDGAKPVEFAHPYDPPLADIVFKDWWRRNVAGGKPIIRNASDFKLSDFGL